MNVVMPSDAHYADPRMPLPVACEPSPDSLTPVNQRMATARPETMGRVTLLSAGPGDVDLMTIRAAKVLASADMVLIDDLCNPALAELAPKARIVQVGKRGGRRSTPLSFILLLMKRYALKGQHVVRVKGGDALLFGRAGEELRFLRDADIPVQIINGISSGMAAAADLGLSLTHRQHCHGVTFVTAHTSDHGEPDWAALTAAGTTLVIYMGMSRIERITQKLGQVMPSDTPAAVVQSAGSAAQRQVVGRLHDVAQQSLDAGLGSPAVILIGRAIGEAPALDLIQRYTNGISGQALYATYG